MTTLFFPSLSLNRLSRPPLSQATAGFLTATSKRLASTTQTSSLAPVIMDEENLGSVKQQLSTLLKSSLQTTLADGDAPEPLVVASTAKFGDYQCNNAMSLWSRLKGKSTEFKGPPSIGQAIKKNIPDNEMIESSSVAGPGFVNIVLSKKWMAKSIQKMLTKGIEIWSPRLDLKVSKAVVDFSSPNIAKEMHVGHLRSTIIGDTIARMLEFSNVEVLRRNHVGDWGTQFGMLIEYLFERFPNWEELGEQAIGDLQAFYKESKQKFDVDPVFKERAQQAVVRLQGGEDRYRKAWTQICEISRKEFDKVYQRLKVHLEEKGESFYNPYIPDVLEKLSHLIEESKGARVIFTEGKSIPLIVVKSDGGYNYASTDLAALWYRLNVEKVKWIIYVTDVGQQMHFDMVFSAAKQAGWLPAEQEYPKTSHVGFGLVLGDDGKRFRTRSSEVVRLADLLDEAKNRSKDALIERAKGLQGNSLSTIGAKVWKVLSHAIWWSLWKERNDRIFEEKESQIHSVVSRTLSLIWSWLRFLPSFSGISKSFFLCKAAEWTAEELEQTAEAVGYGAVKYADLKNNRLTNYTFNFDQMLSDKGNTAVYLLYAHARICSIIRKSGEDIEDLKKTGEVVLDHVDERGLGLHLLQFAEVVEEACTSLLPNVLCEYLYNLSENFTKFYINCPVVKSPEETSRLLICSRLLLCEATAVVMRKCFHLLGIVPVYRL